ncbi:MAG: lipocalin family protein [Rikenellaceae bacterium]
MKNSILIFAFFSFFIRGVAAQEIDKTPVANFDLERYMGTWHEIARFDNRFERDLTSVTAELSLCQSEQGLIQILNRGYNIKDMEWKQAHGRGYTTPISGRLKVSFFLFFTSEYNVMALGDDYEWALVGSRSNRFLWILSRQPQLSPSVSARVVDIARKRGYDVEKLIFLEPAQTAYNQ